VLSKALSEHFGVLKLLDPYPVYMAPLGSHFSNINLLGGDFCTMNRLRPWVNDNYRTVTYYIGKKWAVIPKLWGYYRHI